MKLTGEQTLAIVRHGSARALLLIGMLALLGLSLSTVAFQSVSRHHESRLQLEFQRDVNRRTAVLEQRMSQAVERLRSVGAFFLSSESVEQQEFRDFTAGFLRQQDGLSFIGWAPAVFPDFDDGALADDVGLAAGVAMPLHFVEPGPQAGFASGYDLAQIPGLAIAVEIAFERGYVQYLVLDRGLLLVMPTLDQVDWSGVAVALLPFQALSSWIGLKDWDAALQLIEQSSNQVLLSRRAEEGGQPFYETSVAVDGELWLVRSRPLAQPGTAIAAWATLLAGAVITGLLAFLLITLAGSAARSNQLVLQRTRELEQAEAEARAQAVRLANQVSHSSQLIASIPSLLLGVNKDGVVTEWNRTVHALSGIPPAQAIGTPLSGCNWRGDLEQLCALVAACIEEQQTQRRSDLVFTNADGTEATVGVTCTPLVDSERRPDGCLVVGADVTERNAMELQLRESQRLEAVGRLAAGIAHEVNTPAQFVSDNTSFLKDAFDDLLELEQHYSEVFGQIGEQLSDEQKNRITQAQKAADREYLLEEVPQALEQSMDGIRRIADIVRAMKEFSHPGGGGDKEQVDFNRLITNAVTVAANEWKYHANVETELDENLPALPCYPRELNQVVLNLLINAAHAIAERNDDSGERGTIRISTDVVDNFVRMRVSDTGTGIPEGVRDKIFEPFFTTKEVGRGSGQGLALAYSAVVEKHQGELRFETEMGVGTVFHVNLPLKPQEAAA